MKIIRSYAVILNSEQRRAMLKNADEIGESISESEYIEIIEQMLFDAFLLGMAEPKQIGDV